MSNKLQCLEAKLTQKTKHCMSHCIPQ